MSKPRLTTKMKAVGGKMKNGRLNFGWIPPDERTREQERANEVALAQMPKFKIRGRTDYREGKNFLTDSWKHEATIAALGFPFPGWRQFSGCCVGSGGGNCAQSLCILDAIERQEQEEIVVVFWPLAYGRSRFYMGDTEPGEGSFGGTFAQAAREDGFLDAKREGLPEFKNGDGLEYGERTEISWSDGDARQTLELLNESREHLVETTAECKSADDVRDAIVNFYPCTCASMWGGRMQCKTAGTPEVLLNERAGEWAHQMSVHNWWDHPTLGEIFYIMNQWGKRTHGIDPAGGAPGGFWITKKDMDWICRNGEVFAFSGYKGFEARVIDLDWRGRQ